MALRAWPDHRRGTGCAPLRSHHGPDPRPSVGEKQGHTESGISSADPRSGVYRAGRSALERVMNLGENRIEMQIPRAAWFPRDLRVSRIPKPFLIEFITASRLRRRAGRGRTLHLSGYVPPPSGAA